MKRLAVAVPLTKRCSRCGIAKSLGEFAKRKGSRDGTTGYCIECKNKRGREYARTHREIIAGSHRRWKAKHYRNYWAIKTIHNHKKDGYEVSLSSHDLTELAKKTDYCFFCGRALDWSANKGRLNDSSPTLERLENGKTITPNNTAILCYSCNRTKGNRLKERDFNGKTIHKNTTTKR